MKPLKRATGRYEHHNPAGYGGLSRFWGLGDREHRASSNFVPMVSQPAQMIAPPVEAAPAPVSTPVASMEMSAASSASFAPSTQNAPPGTAAVNPNAAAGYQPYQEQQQQLPFQYALMFPGMMPGMLPPPPQAAPVPASAPKLTPLAIPGSVQIGTQLKADRFTVNVTSQQAKVGKIAAAIAAYLFLF